MAQVATDQKLRDMAEHRGLKLVKSRRRKPGVGDYGKFGLIDAAGKPLLGIGAQGLEASAQDFHPALFLIRLDCRKGTRHWFFR